MIRALLNIACGTSCIMLSLFAQIPALAAGPYELSSSEETSFPTWHAGRGTRLCVQNLDSQNSGKVRVQAALASPEYIEVGSGAMNCIDRGWAGFDVNVRNEGQTSVKVWTE
ncbi:MAG: hypothetical protein HY785_28900 [Oscillatoriophycideae cyanobacterium NC_groundwater_1537_Pr4_S-0.65um_50_18]|nr:hypothetical protein [Oscillatoriophycideae cyanobacterium NC_groundwater_1537_Pr4_S-0.65um_50_18]